MDAVELTQIVRTAARRAFRCSRHGENLTNCSGCIIESRLGRPVPTIAEIMQRPVEAAAKATDSLLSALAYAQTAADRAHEFRGNGYGVVHDPADLRRDITAAIGFLQQARAIIDATAWPTDEDYRSGQ